MNIKINNNMISEEEIFFLTEFINKFRKETAPGWWYMVNLDITDKTVTVEIERSADKRKVTMTTNRMTFTSSDKMSGVYWTIKDDDFELLIREPITKLWRLFKERHLDYQEALKERIGWQRESAKAAWQTATLSDD